MTQGMALELLCLGIVLGNPDCRKMVEERDWSSVEMQCIVSELKNGGGGKQKVYHYLERWMLEMCGVEWKPPRKPVPEALAKLKRNGTKSRVLTQLQRISETGFRTLDLDLDKFFICIARAYSEAVPEIEKLLKEEEEKDGDKGNKTAG